MACIYIYIVGAVRAKHLNLMHQWLIKTPNDSPSEIKFMIICFGLFSGVTIWTGFEVLLLWAKANDIGYWFSFSDNPILFIGLFIVIPSWNSFWFFCIHRALHWPPLYRIAHHVHHRNVSVGPWSGNAMHPLEHLIWMAGALIYIPLAAILCIFCFHSNYQF